MPVNTLEPWNPFDTSDKICFPSLYEALIPGSTAAVQTSSTVVDIDVLARNYAASINELQPPDLGYLPLEVTNALEDKCQAWFDEQRRIKAIRGDSPTPSCSFTLPGIPFRDHEASYTSQHALPATASRQASAPIAAQAPIAVLVSEAVLPADGMPAEHGMYMHQALPASQPAAQSSRSSFTFAPFAGQGGQDSPKHQYGVEPVVSMEAPPHQLQMGTLQDAQQSQQRVQQPAVQQLSPFSTTSKSNPVRQNASQGATHQSVTVANAASTSSRLSWLMKQNLVQLQQVLEPERASPQQQERADEADQQLQLLQRNLEQQALQQRVSLLLHTNQQQLQQLLASYQQQELLQQQHHTVQGELQTAQLQQQQPNTPQRLQQLLLGMQRQLSQLQLVTQQSPRQYEQPVPWPVLPSQRSERLLQAAGVYTATTGAAANTATMLTQQQTAADSAAVLPGSYAAQPKTVGRGRAAAPAAVSGKHGRSSPVTGGEWKDVCTAGTAAAAAANTPAAALSSPFRQSASSSSPVHCGSRSPVTRVYNPHAVVFRLGRGSGMVRASQQQVKAVGQQYVSAAAGQNSSGSIETCNAAREGQLQAWKGLQALQQQRWQQRLQAEKAAGGATFIPTKDKSVQTDLASDQSVQIDEVPSVRATTPAAAAAGNGAAQGAASAAANAVLHSFGQPSPDVATNSYMVPSSGDTADNVIAAMYPVAAAAVAAAVAAATASTGNQQGNPLQAAQPSATAAAAAAAAAVAAAVVGASGITSPPAWQQQLQHSPPSAGQPSGSGFAIVPSTGFASAPPAAHVVRSLFGQRPSSAVAAVGAPYAQVALSGQGMHSPGTCASRKEHRYPQQEQLHVGPAALQQQQQHWQQQRPLPWPQLPNLDSKPHLSPMKAYVNSCGSDAYGRAMGTPGATKRRPLGETTNSPGAINTAAHFRRASASPRHAMSSAAGAARIEAAMQQEHSNVSRSISGKQPVACGGAGVTSTSGAAVITVAVSASDAIAAAAVAEPSVGVAAAEGPAVSAAGAGSNSAFVTPTKQLVRRRVADPAPRRYASELSPSCVVPTATGEELVVLGSAGLSTVSGAVTLGSPALQRLWSGYKATWMHARSPPAHASEVYRAAVAEAHSTAAQQLTSPEPAVPGISTVVATVQPSSDNAHAAAALTMLGPVYIDARFYPPSARKLLNQWQPEDQNDTATVATAPAPALGASASEVPDTAVQQSELWQLQQLLEQQLLEMDLLGKNAAEAATAMAGSRAAAEPAHVHSAAVGDEALQRGCDADVDTDSPEVLQHVALVDSADDSDNVGSGGIDTDSDSDSTGSPGYRAAAHEHTQLHGSRLASANRIQRMIYRHRQAQPQSGQSTRGQQGEGALARMEVVHDVNQQQCDRPDGHSDTDLGGMGMSEMIRRFLKE